MPVDDETLRRLVAEVTREVAAETGGPTSGAPAWLACAGASRPGGASRAVVTTTGKNQRGIVANIAQAIAEAGGDIVDISQTLVSDYFTMIIIVDTAALAVPFAEFKAPRRAGGRGARRRVPGDARGVVNALQRV